MVIRGRDGGESETIMWLSKAVVVAAAQQQCNRLGVAIGIEKIAAAIEAHAKWIHLPPRDLFDGRPIRSKPIGVSRLHFQNNGALTPAFDLRGIPETVASVYPAVQSETKRILVSVRVRKVEWPIKNFPHVSGSISIGIG